MHYINPHYITLHYKTSVRFHFIIQQSHGLFATAKRLVKGADSRFSVRLLLESDVVETRMGTGISVAPFCGCGREWVQMFVPLHLSILIINVTIFTISHRGAYSAFHA